MSDDAKVRINVPVAVAELASLLTRLAEQYPDRAVRQTHSYTYTQSSRRAFLRVGEDGALEIYYREVSS